MFKVKWTIGSGDPPKKHRSRHSILHQIDQFLTQTIQDHISRSGTSSRNLTSRHRIRYQTDQIPARTIQNHVSCHDAQARDRAKSKGNPFFAQFVSASIDATSLFYSWNIDVFNPQADSGNLVFLKYWCFIPRRATVLAFLHVVRRVHHTEWNNTSIFRLRVAPGWLFAVRITNGMLQSLFKTPRMHPTSMPIEEAPLRIQHPNTQSK